MKMLLRNMNESTRTLLWHLALLLILGAGLLVRCHYLVPREFDYDEALYAWSADRLAADITLIFSAEIADLQPPLFPFLLMFGKSILGLPPELLSYRFVTVLISLLGVIGIFLLGSRVSSSFLGFFSAFCLTFNASSILNSIYLLNDVPFAALSIFLLLALKKVEETKHWKADVWVGVILMLMITIKNTALVLILLVVMFYLFLPGLFQLRVRFQKLATTLAIPLVALSFLSILNHLHRGVALPILSALQFDEGSFRKTWYLFGYFVGDYHPQSFVFLFLWGCLYVWRKKNFFQSFLIAYVLIIFGSLINLIAYDHRYALFMVPPFLLIVGLGVESLLGSFFRKKYAVYLVRICIIGFLGIWYVKDLAMVDNSLKLKAALIPDYSAAGAWIKERATDPTIIFAQEPRIVRYYTRVNLDHYGGRVVRIPEYPMKQEISDILAKHHGGHAVMIVNARRDFESGADFHPFTASEDGEAFLRERDFLLRKIFYQERCGGGSGPCEVIPMVKVFERGMP